MLSLLKNLVYVEALVAFGYAIFYFCLSAEAKREIGFRPAIIFMILSAAGFLSPNVWVLHAVAFIVIPLMARSRDEVGLLLMAGMVAIPGFVTRLMIGSFQMSDHYVQTTIAIGAAVALLLKPAGKRPYPVSADIPVLLLVLLIAWTSARDTSVTNALRQLVTLGTTVLVPYFVLTRSVVSLRSLQRFTLWLVAIGCMLSAVAIYEAVTHWPLYLAMESRLGFRDSIISVKFRAGLLRAGGPLLEPLTLGFVLEIGLVAALVARRRFGSLLLWLSVLALIAFGVIATGSRGAWLGVGVALVGFALYTLRARRMFAAGGSAVLAGLILYFIQASTAGETDMAGTVDYRQRLLELGIEEFWKNPWIGTSLANLTPRLESLRQGEQIIDFVNSYLYYALTGGIFGVAVYGACLLWPVAALWFARRRLSARPAAKLFGAFAFAFLCSATVMLAFISFGGIIALIVLTMIGFSGLLSHLREDVRRRNPTRRRPNIEKVRRRLEMSWPSRLQC